MIEKTITKKSIIKKAYLIDGVLFLSWIIYLTSFYLFYKEAYFYIDKRLSLFLQIISLLKDNWNESIVYFIISFLLMVCTLFFLYFIYKLSKKINGHKKSMLFFTGTNALLILLLLFNAYWTVFIVIFILAASVVYVIFILAETTSQKDECQYEEGEVIEIKGPFISEEQAEEAAVFFLDHWKEKEIFPLDKEIYKDIDNQYYIEIFIEVDPK